MQTDDDREAAPSRHAGRRAPAWTLTGRAVLPLRAGCGPRGSTRRRAWSAGIRCGSLGRLCEFQDDGGQVGNGVIGAPQVAVLARDLIPDVVARIGKAHVFCAGDKLCSLGCAGDFSRLGLGHVALRFAGPHRAAHVSNVVVIGALCNHLIVTAAPDARRHNVRGEPDTTAERKDDESH